MATPTKEPAPPTMEQSLSEFAQVLKRLKLNLTLLVQGDSKKFSDVVADAADVAKGIQEFILGLAIPPTVGSQEGLIQCCEICKLECQNIEDLLKQARPRFAEAGAGGSLTEGAKIDKLLEIVEKLLPLILRFLI